MAHPSKLALSVEELAPLALEEQDHLGVELDPTDDSKFLMRVRSLTTVSENSRPGSGRYVVGNQTFYDFWFGPGSAALTFFERLPEVEWSAGKKRHVSPATDLMAAIVVKSWGLGRIIFSTKEAEQRMLDLVASYRRGRNVAELTASFKQQRVQPTLPTGWTERADRPLADYQRAAACAALCRPEFGLLMDRGTGKTATAIQLVTLKCKPDRMLKVLVLCPAQVRLNWQREFDRFATKPGKVAIVRGDLPERVRLIATMAAAESSLQFSAAIMSYDSMVRTIDYVSMVEWDLCICDESHYFKDQRTNRWKAMEKLRESCRERIIMSGSPIGNTPMDLWTQLEFLTKGGSGFSSFKAFRSFYGVFERQDGGRGVEKLVGLKNLPYLQERLSRMTFSVTKAEAGLNLPDKVMRVEEVQMLEYQADVYRRLQEQLAVEIEDKLSGDVVDEVTVNNVLTMLLRLAQVTSGYITYDAKVDPDSGETLVPKRTQELCPTNPKIDALMDLILAEDRDPKAKTIVWCVFVPNIKRICDELTARGVKHVAYYGSTSERDRDVNVDAFNNDPACKVIVCNPQTAGEGLNLLGYDINNPDDSDTYCDQEVFFSSNWSAIQRSQAEDRAHRRGTRMPVQVIDLVVPGTIDEEILDRVTGKRQMALAVTDLRETLGRVLKTMSTTYSRD